MAGTSSGGSGCLLVILGLIVAGVWFASQQEHPSGSGGGPVAPPQGGGGGSDGGGRDEGPVSVSGPDVLGRPDLRDPYDNARDAQARLAALESTGCDGVLQAGWKDRVYLALRNHYGRYGVPAQGVMSGADLNLSEVTDVANERNAAYFQWNAANQEFGGSDVRTRQAYERYLRADRCFQEIRTQAFQALRDMGYDVR